MCLPFLLVFLTSMPFLFVQGGRTLTCACTTDPCREDGATTCNTTGVCFSQFLDRGDGSEKLLRGCIHSRTPLLCENRRPAVGSHRKWPVLVCCGRSMCNAKVAPTLPPVTTTTVIPSPDLADDQPAESEKSSRSMMYLLSVAIFVCCVGVGTATAVFLSRRHTTFCDPEFGTVRPNGYVKGCSEPPKSKIIDNKVTLVT